MLQWMFERKFESEVKWVRATQSTWNDTNMMYHFPYTVYHSKNSSYSSSFRFAESSLTVEVLEWWCKIKTVQNPTDIVESVWVAKGLLFAQELIGSKPVEEECQNQLSSYHFSNFVMKIHKILEFLSCNSAPWVWAE